MSIVDEKVWIGATRADAKSPWVWDGTGNEMTYDNTEDCYASGRDSQLPRVWDGTG